VIEGSRTPSPEDEMRSSFRNVVFFRIPDDGKLSNPGCHTTSSESFGDFSLFHGVDTVSGAQPPIQLLPQTLSAEEMRLGREAEHSASPSAETKIATS
jgi:hypothetical protein